MICHLIHPMTGMPDWGVRNHSVCQKPITGSKIQLTHMLIVAQIDKMVSDIKVEKFDLHRERFVMDFAGWDAGVL